MFFFFFNDIQPIGASGTENSFDSKKNTMMMEMNFGMHVTYKLYWNMQNGIIFLM